MNYIKQLQQENAELKAEHNRIKEDIDELRRYLGGSKFSVDPTVQTGDVFHRLPVLYTYEVKDND